MTCQGTGRNRLYVSTPPPFDPSHKGRRVSVPCQRREAPSQRVPAQRVPASLAGDCSAARAMTLRVGASHPLPLIGRAVAVRAGLHPGEAAALGGWWDSVRIQHFAHPSCKIVMAVRLVRASGTGSPAWPGRRRVRRGTRRSAAPSMPGRSSVARWARFTPSIVPGMTTSENNRSGAAPAVQHRQSRVRMLGLDAPGSRAAASCRAVAWRSRVIVLDQQHRLVAASDGAGVGRPRSEASLIGTARQIQPERRAETRLAIDRQMAARLLHEAEHHRRAQGRFPCPAPWW